MATKTRPKPLVDPHEGSVTNPTISQDQIFDQEDGDQEDFAGTETNPEIVQEKDVAEMADEVGLHYEDGEELNLNKKLQEEQTG